MEPIDLIRAGISDPSLSDEDRVDIALTVLTTATEEQVDDILGELEEEGLEDQVEAFRTGPYQQAKEHRENDTVLDFYSARQDPDVAQKAALATGGALLTGASLAGGAPAAAGGALAKGTMAAIRFGLRHKFLSSVVGGLGTYAFLSQGEAFDEADPGTGAPYNAGPLDPSQPPSEEDPVVGTITDPASGQIVPIRQSELDAEFTTPLDPNQIGLEPDFGPGLSIGDRLAAYEAQQGAVTGTPAGDWMGRNVLGSVTVDEPRTLPSLSGHQFPARTELQRPLVRRTGGSGSSAGERGAGFSVGSRVGQGFMESGEFAGRVTSMPANPYEQLFGRSPDALLSARGGAREDYLGPIDVPKGAQLAPRAFSEYRGRPLIDYAREAATRYGVPLNVLYGLIDLESNWDPNAIGDGGTSFGLVQIHRPAFPSISRTQALDPEFAIDFAAKNLKQRYDRYGSWDAAIAAHNSPVAADYLAQTGQFYNEKSQSYTTEVLNRANSSGLSSRTFDFAAPGSGQTTGTVGQWASLAGSNAVFPVEGAEMPNASQIGLPRDGGARQHQGLDIMADYGTPIYATVGGQVRYAANRGGKGGYAVSIEDAQGNWHYYAHLDPSSASLWQQQGITEGAIVNPGSLIGYVGDTGNAKGTPHLHYSINEGRKNAPLIDPFDFLTGSQQFVEPEFDPFTAPDPAVSRDYIQSLYEDLLGREPTEEERQEGLQRVTAMQRSEYYRGIRQARGLETQPIDIDTRLQQELRESGEFAFNEERQELRSFTDYAANIAAMLQGI